MDVRVWLTRPIASTFAFIIFLTAGSACVSEEAPQLEGETVAEVLSFQSQESLERIERYLHDERELAIQACMVKEGFDYQPTTYPGLSGWVPTSREEAAEFGFGITRVIETVDPQADNRAELDEFGAQAFAEAMWSEDGCARQAADLEHGLGLDRELWVDLEPIFERAAADLRMIELDDEWSRCIAEQGIGLSGANRNELVENLYLELEPVLNVSDFPPQAAIDREAEVAVVAWDCEEPLAELRKNIHAEYQRDFIESNAGQLLSALDRRNEILSAANE